MKIKTLEGTSSKALVNAFNASFADYFTPFQLSKEQLISKMAADKTDLSLSVGAFDNEKLSGFILHGFDVVDNLKVVYNGGTGVIPEQRGAGLTKKMYQYVLPILKSQKVNIVQLEVITGNIQAIRSYENSGFKTERKVLCYKGEAEVTNANKAIEIKKLQGYDWDLMKSFWGFQPTWQNSNNVLDRIKGNTVALGAYLNNRMVGYAIFDPNNKRIHQIAIGPNFRRKKIGSAMIGEIINTCGNSLSIINVDERSKSIHGFLKSLGFENFLDQYEMQLQLT